MTTITTKFVTDGNSTAIRLPKQVLAMSGLSGSVQLSVKRGQITIKQVRQHPREGWQKQIEKVLKEESYLKDDDFSDMDGVIADGLDNLEPWDGPTYEQWLKQNAKK